MFSKILHFLHRHLKTPFVFLVTASLTPSLVNHATAKGNDPLTKWQLVRMGQNSTISAETPYSVWRESYLHRFTKNQSSFIFRDIIRETDY